LRPKKITDNPLVMLIEESIRLKDSAQLILSGAMGSTSLSRIERLVLIMIAEADAPMTASQMGRHLGHSRQVIQRAANQLAGLGLLEKVPNPDHKASSLFVATAEGLAFEAQLGEALDGMVHTLLTEQDMKLCVRLTRDLHRLRTLIESSGHGR